MKVLYTSDLHGEIHLYEELLKLALSFYPEIMALGGDLLPSFPPTKRYEDMIPNQKLFINQFLLPFFSRLVKTTSVRQILLIPGNWDLGYPYLFKTGQERIIDLNQKIHRTGNGYEFIGYPYVPPTPFRPKDYEKMDDLESAWPPQKYPSYVRSPDHPDQLVPIDPHLYFRQRGTIQEDLGRLIKPSSRKRTVYVMHSPPFGTRLDSIQGSKSAGSRSVRTFIEETQPLLTLHGHIHESPELSGSFSDRLGETISINPGQSSREGNPFSRLNAVTFELEDLDKTLAHTCLN